MNITKNLFFSVGLLLCISAHAAEHSQDQKKDWNRISYEQGIKEFNQIKQAVFAKKADPDSESKFNDTHPNPTHDAVNDLVEDNMDLVCPASPTATLIRIGEEEIWITDWAIATTVLKYDDENTRCKGEGLWHTPHYSAKTKNAAKE